jgi:hypothetical protein
VPNYKLPGVSLSMVESPSKLGSRSSRSCTVGVLRIRSSTPFAEVSAIGMQGGPQERGYPRGRGAKGRRTTADYTPPARQVFDFIEVSQFCSRTCGSRCNAMPLHRMDHYAKKRRTNQSAVLIRQESVYVGGKVFSLTPAWIVTFNSGCGGTRKDR